MKGESPTEEELKLLKQIGNQMIKLNKKILEMGYDVYLSTHGRANIMKGPTHDDGMSPQPLLDNVVYSFILENWDGGDW